MKILNICLPIILTFLIINSSNTQGTTWYVNKDGSGDSQTIGWAVVALAQSGDTVLVDPGDYHESTITIRNKSVFLISEEGPEVTIIYYLGVPGNEDYTVIRVWDATSPGCVIGFTIRGARNGFNECGGAISIIRSNVLIKNNIITRNWCANGAGICCMGSPYPTIENNLIYLNEGWVGGGILIFRCSPIIRSNTIANNLAEVVGGGIDIRHNTSFPIIEHNIIVYNKSPQGGGVASSTPDTNITFSCNDVWSNATSNYYDQISDRTGIDGNISLNPMFCGEYGTGNYYLQLGSPCSEHNVPDCCDGHRIGYYPVNCETGTERSSWGNIKKRLRNK